MSHLIFTMLYIPCNLHCDICPMSSDLIISVPCALTTVLSSIIWPMSHTFCILSHVICPMLYVLCQLPCAICPISSALFPPVPCDLSTVLSSIIWLMSHSFRILPHVICHIYMSYVICPVSSDLFTSVPCALSTVLSSIIWPMSHTFCILSHVICPMLYVLCQSIVTSVPCLLLSFHLSQVPCLPSCLPSSDPRPTHFVFYPMISVLCYTSYVTSLVSCVLYLPLSFHLSRVICLPSCLLSSDPCPIHLEFCPMSSFISTCPMSLSSCHLSHVFWSFFICPVCSVYHSPHTVHCRLCIDYWVLCDFPYALSIFPCPMYTALYLSETTLFQISNFLYGF